MLISPDVFALHVVDKSLVYNTVTPRRWIVACKVPVTRIRGTGQVQKHQGILTLIDLYITTLIYLLSVVLTF